MGTLFLFAALAATTSTVQSEAADPAVAAVPVGTFASADADAVALAMSGPTVALTMRGTTIEVVAAATPQPDGCTSLVTAHATGKRKAWSREFRWRNLAWIGSAADGRTMFSFFEPEGRLAADTVTFTPTDAIGFRAAVTRMSTACRASRGDSERIAFGAQGPMRNCYFPRLPSLQLIDSSVSSPMPLPSRAFLSVLARENPQAELQLLLERVAPDPAAKDPTSPGDDWGNPIVAFIFADSRVKDMQIASARFALDGKPVTAQHAVAGYGDTRVRIIMDPFASAATGKVPISFYRRLTNVSEVTLNLLDASGQSRVVLNFDAGPALAAARKALSAADWSCDGASPAPIPAARWQPAE